MNSSSFISEILSGDNFNWFVTLRFDPKRRRSGMENRTPMECVYEWLDQLETPPPVGPGVRNYLWLQEAREDGVVLFHILAGNFGGDEGTWIHLWKEISGGSGWTRVLNDHVGGLIRHLVMKVGCPLETYADGTYESYTVHDFSL